MKQKEKLGNLVLLAVILCSVGQAQALDRGHRVLVDKGLQIQALSFAFETGYFDIHRWAESNFTTISLSGGLYRTPLLPPAPGIPWTRWMYHGAPYPANADIEPSEYPFVSNLVNLQVKDEQDITDPAELAGIVAAFASIHSRHPDVIVHTNGGGGNTHAEIRHYMQQTQPDMLMHCAYEFQGNLAGGSPTKLYKLLEKFRELGLEGNDGTGSQPIPTAVYIQTFIHQGHIISESEIRLNNFAAWAFGYKMVQAFIYENHPALSSSIPSVMFSGNGTAKPTPQFYQTAETNRQSLNLGPALVRLISTDVRMKMGRHEARISTVNNRLPRGVSSWDNTADPYITSIAATNLGSKNNGLEGDVIVGYFKPLDASFTNLGHEDDIYFMILNGLSDGIGLPAETRQRIRIHFDFGNSGINSLQRLSRDTGLVEKVALVSDGGSRYHLDLVLDGGTGDLFKFNNGGTFVGSVVLLSGDVNGDGFVGAVDWNVILQNWGMTGATREQGDLNYDGTVGAADYNEVLSHWGEGTLPEAPGEVPEPSTLLLLAGGVLAGLIRRQR